jgi:3-oxoadipate enol-lactonase
VLRKSLQATTHPRPALLAQGAVGATFRRDQPALAFLYAQIDALNSPREEDFGKHLYAVRTPLADYAAARVPTLLVTSAEDVMIWPELVEHCHAKLPGSRLLRVPNAGHSTYFEQPAIFNREVRAFLQEHRP